MPRIPDRTRWAACPAIAGILFSACSTLQIKKDSDAARALVQVCDYGTAHGRISGAVWIKAESPEAKGQFPAEVEARGPDYVFMEITNLIGETQARIQVDGATYKIEVPGQEARVEEGSGTWGGIPLEWAAALFLGRFPCPELSDSRLSIRKEVDDVVVAERFDGSGKILEEYYYRLRSWAGKPWPRELQWTRPGGTGAVSVSFKFEQPDADTDAPMRWEAKSDRGEVKVRWRRRNIEKASTE